MTLEPNENDVVIDGDRDGCDEIDGSRVQSPPAGCDLSFVSVVDQDRPPTSYIRISLFNSMSIAHSFIIIREILILTLSIFIAL